MKMLRLISFIISCTLTLAAAPIWHEPCGESKYANAGDLPIPFISGGVELRPYEFPWMVSLRDAAGQHYCGGAIITDRWILTTASCVDGKTTFSMTAVIGEYNTSQSSHVRHDMEINEIWKHGGYNPQTRQNDIALIHTRLPMTFNVDIQPVCAPDPDDQVGYINMTSHSPGWGTMTEGVPCCTEVPYYMTLPVAPNPWCSDEYTMENITPDMVCGNNSGNSTRDTCDGDIGGPMTVKNADGTFALVGLSSWGYGCGIGYPPVYTRVGYFTAWISAIIEGTRAKDEAEATVH